MFQLRRFFRAIIQHQWNTFVAPVHRPVRHCACLNDVTAGMAGTRGRSTIKAHQPFVCHSTTDLISVDVGVHAQRGSSPVISANKVTDLIVEDEN